MHKWYVVQVISGHEKKVKKRLEENRESMGMTNLIEEVLVPSEMISEVKSGDLKVSEKRLWPGYMFIKMEMTDASWGYVKGTDGVIGFPGGDKPQPLTESEVNEILSELADKKKGVVQKHKFSEGDTVKITNGVFENFNGTILEVNQEKGRLSVLVSIFGRETRVDDLEFWQVEQVQENR
ncbi:MAG TPA: transcription termination/antitermination protein NusG [Chlamydiales bacterium]|nr:transcription termination/antitermination protein NusG [Chlamydiales bacterium]